MNVRLCGAQLGRLGTGGMQLYKSLREAGHAVQMAGCLDRCKVCETQVVASADGMPIAAANPAELMEQVAAIAAAEEGE